MTDLADSDGASEEQRDFVRDAVVFQGKLLLDGLRDLLLFPVSLVAAGVDLIKREDPPGRRFYEVLHFGKQTEQWIDLFAAANGVDPETPRSKIDAPSLDELVSQVEQRIKAEREKGDISGRAREALERVLTAARETLRHTARKDQSKDQSEYRSKDYSKDQSGPQEAPETEASERDVDLERRGPDVVSRGTG